MSRMSSKNQLVFIREEKARTRFVRLVLMPPEILTASPPNRDITTKGDLRGRYIVTQKGRSFCGIETSHRSSIEHLAPKDINQEWKGNRPSFTARLAVKRGKPNRAGR